MDAATPADPQGFVGATAHLGLRDTGDDFMVIVSSVPSTSAAVFTQSHFAGCSVQISRQVAESGAARGVLTIAKNANVATGDVGLADALEVQDQVAAATDISAGELFVASTGVIGRPYPMDQIREGIAGITQPLPAADFDAAAAAIMTTDTKAKCVRTRIGAGPASVVGIAKGVGMIEPNMATMLAYFFTDAAVDAETLDAVFRRVVDVTFNSLSIDTDTSTSDTALIVANGLAGSVDIEALQAALYEVALQLVTMIATDGEGATKRIEVHVNGAANAKQARRVGKAIVNSPLVKTAVHGADPNWGRVIMAIGKVHQEQIDPTSVTVAFGPVPVFPGGSDQATLAAAQEYLRGEVVEITVTLGSGPGSWRVYGCDLSEGYVRINADYTT